MGSQLNLKVRKLPHSGGSQGSCLLPGTLIPMACTLGKQGQKAEQVPISHTNIPKSKLFRAREGHRVLHRNSGAHKSGGVGSGQESHLSRSKPGKASSSQNLTVCTVPLPGARPSPPHLLHPRPRAAHLLPGPRLYPFSTRPAMSRKCLDSLECVHSDSKATPTGQGLTWTSLSRSTLLLLVTETRRGSCDLLTFDNASIGWLCA